MDLPCRPVVAIYQYGMDQTAVPQILIQTFGLRLPQQVVVALHSVGLLLH